MRTLVRQTEKTCAAAWLILVLAMPISVAGAGDVSVYIDVVGAPGDGEKALGDALSERLLDQGFALSGRPAEGAYEIQGIVKVTPSSGGKQTVRIDWTVLSPDGAQLGIVTQENTVRKGVLDKKWGGAAEAAAEDAAEDIAKLLPQAQ